MTAEVYNSMVAQEKFAPFDLPKNYEWIEPECQHHVDRQHPAQFYAWCCGLLLAGEPIPILLDVPF